MTSLPTSKTAMAPTSSATANPLSPQQSRPLFVDRIKRGLTVLYGEPSIEAGLMPTDEERSILAQEITRLSDLLAQRDNDAASNALALVLTSMPSASQGFVDAALRARAYMLALDDVPSWGIVEACRRLVKGQVEEHQKFCPTPPEFRAIVNDVTAPLRYEILMYERIMGAKAHRVIPTTPPAAQAGESYAEKIGEGRKAGNWMKPDLLADLAARRKKREAEAEVSAPDGEAA